MRISFTAAPVSQRPILKRQYADLLRSLMRSMKENYEELIQSSTSGAAPTGAYLSFSHHVVSLLQQHTTEIVEIDKYFTDSSAFPLPAADPNYVISRLKKYTMNLSRPGTQKELNVFLMTQCERVAQTGEWDLLVGWLDTAICETVELQTPDQLGFRGYFCCAILPAYIDVALRYPGGWVLATPMLKVAERVAMTMRAGVDATKQESRDLAMDMLDSILISIRRVIGRMIASVSSLLLYLFFFLFFFHCLPLLYLQSS